MAEKNGAASSGRAEASRVTERVGDGREAAQFGRLTAGARDGTRVEGFGRRWARIRGADYVRTGSGRRNTGDSRKRTATRGGIAGHLGAGRAKLRGDSATRGAHGIGMRMLAWCGRGQDPREERESGFRRGQGGRPLRGRNERRCGRSGGARAAGIERRRRPFDELRASEGAAVPAGRRRKRKSKGKPSGANRLAGRGDARDGGLACRGFFRGWFKARNSRRGGQRDERGALRGAQGTRGGKHDGRSMPRGGRGRNRSDGGFWLGDFCSVRRRGWDGENDKD
jgi:hypothetical protein